MPDPGRPPQDRGGPRPTRPAPGPASGDAGRPQGQGLPAPGRVPVPPRDPRYQGQPPGPQYYNPAQARPGAPGQRPGAPGNGRGPAGPGQVPAYGVPDGRARPGPAPQGGGQQRPRPPAGLRPPSPYGPQPAAMPAPPVQEARGRRGRRVLVRDVHSRRVIRKLDVWSVFKVSFIFYLCVLFVLVAAGVAIWNVAAAFGVITTLDKSIRSLFALKSFRLHPITALVWGSAIGAGLCLLGVLVNVVASVFYNLISDLVGGIQVISLSDRERARRRPADGVDGPVTTGAYATGATPSAATLAGAPRPAPQAAAAMAQPTLMGAPPASPTVTGPARANPGTAV